MFYAQQNHVAEWTLFSTQRYDDPFHTVQLHAVVSAPDGKTQHVPAFWDGENRWKIRYSAHAVGDYALRTVCSSSDDGGLHDRQAALRVTEYQGTNPLLRHGPVRRVAGKQYLEHADGTPFFWLGDTWWMCFTGRLQWPDQFRELAVDRVAKGFSVIQAVAGLFPDMGAFDPRGANAAGYPWQDGFTTINPAFWDVVDLRIAHLVQMGLAPCLFGSWGYYLELAGPEVLADHWRYLVARYGAYPVIWCVAGEAMMPYYLNAEHHRSSPTWQAETAHQWSELARHIRAIDPFAHPITIHPTRYGRQQVDDPTVLDLEMLQTGHSGYLTLGPTVAMLEESLAAEPMLPVLVGEVNYEGILESSREEIQRFLFWSCVLSGAAGHTYGANGLWQVNTREQPYGASPHGTAWGHTTWDEAYRLPGSRQIGMGKALLERLPWWEFRPHPEWIAPHADADNRMSAYAAGIADQVRVFFVPSDAVWVMWRGEMRLRALGNTAWRAYFFDPKTGTRYPFTVRADADGEVALPKPPIFQDWVVVLEGEGAAFTVG